MAWTGCLAACDARSFPPLLRPPIEPAHGSRFPSPSQAVLPYPDPDLRDEAVVLRCWRYDDLHCVAEAASDPTIPEGTTVPAAYSVVEARRFIERQWARRTKGDGLSLVIADRSDDRARGLIALIVRPTPGIAGVGYWLVPSARGHGRATRAVGLLSHWALSTAGLQRLEALVEPHNRASGRVLEKCGFREEGLLRSYLRFGERRADALTYSLLPSDPTHRNPTRW